MASTKSAEEIELDRLNETGSRIGTARPPPQKLTFWSLLRSPFTTIHRILAFITAFFPFISRFTLPTTPSRRQLSPQDTASRFIREFEERYGREHVPFEDRGYAGVTQQVKTSLQFLMVILVSEEHDDTAAFCKDVLCDVELLNWVQANDCVVWAGNVADSEAHTVSNSLTCTRYPFVALIANIPSPTPSSPSQMTLLARIEGPATPAQLTTALTTAVTRTLPLLNRRRALLREQNQARELRRMQEEAYTNSLAADRARQQAERQAQAEQSRHAALEAQRTQAQELAARNKEQWRLWKAADLRKRGIIDMKSEIGKTARVGIRLSGGERIVQIFPGEWSVSEVYAFVECYDLLFPSPMSGITLRSAADTTVVGDFEKPERYEHEFGFRLVMPVAKKTIESGGMLIKEESELWPSGNIVVEQLDESDSEESEDEGDR